MIALKVHNEFLHLEEGEKITIDFNNNFFTLKLVKDSFSYSFKIPSNGHNRRILGNIGLLDSTEDYQENTEVEIYILHQFWKRALLSISEGSYNDYIQIQIDLDYGEFNQLVGTMTLRDLVEGYTFDLASEVSQPVWTFVVPDRHRNGEEYSSEGSGGGLGLENNRTEFILVPKISQNDSDYFEYRIKYSEEGLFQTLRDLAAFINEEEIESPRFEAATREDRIILTPINYPSYIFELTIQTLPLAVDRYDIVQNVPEYAIQPAYDHFVFPTLEAPGFYEEKNPDFEGLLNVYNGRTYTFNDPNTPEGERNKYALVPMFFLKFIFQRIEEISGYKITGDFLEDEEIGNLIFFNSFALDKDGGYPFPFNSFNPVIEYENHFPEMTVNELLEEIQMFCVYPKFDYERKTLSLNYRRNVFLSNSYEDISSRATISKEMVEKRKNIRLGFADGSGIKSIKIGDYQSTEEIKFNLITLAQGENYPIYFEKGNSEMFGLGTENEYPPTLLFWRGLIDGQPVAESAANYGAYALDWRSPQGLYESFWKEFVNFRLRAKKAEARILFNLNSMLRLSRDMDEKRKLGNLLYLIESVRIQVENSEAPLRRPASATLHKIPLS